MEKIRNDFMHNLNWLMIATAITIFYINQLHEGPITWWSHLCFAAGYLTLGIAIKMVTENNMALVFLIIATVFVTFMGLAGASEMPLKDYHKMKWATTILFSFCHLFMGIAMFVDFVTDKKHIPRTNP